jgi:hypothetical protein
VPSAPPRNAATPVGQLPTDLVGQRFAKRRDAQGQVDDGAPKSRRETRATEPLGEARACSPARPRLKEKRRSCEPEGLRAARSELVACCGASDRSPYEPAPAQRERRETCTCNVCSSPRAWERVGSAPASWIGPRSSRHPTSLEAASWSWHRFLAVSPRVEDVTRSGFGAPSADSLVFVFNAGPVRQLDARSVRLRRRSPARRQPAGRPACSTGTAWCRGASRLSLRIGSGEY